MAHTSLLQAGLDMNLENLGIKVGRDVIIHDTSVRLQILFNGTLGIGESYVQGKWSTPTPIVLRDVLARGIEAKVPIGSFDIPDKLLKLGHKFLNLGTKKNAQKIAAHYDTGNILMERMLGPEMCYTCGYYGRGALTHDQAQRDKKYLICEKIDLKPGQRVLDIGCGFGSFAKEAASRGAHVTGITLSDEQLLYAKESCRGLDVDLQKMNYLELLKNFKPHSFDHVVSIGMFEHVAPKNYELFMQIQRQLVKPEGFVFLHCIGGDGAEPWLNKFIFPGGVLPNERQIVDAYRSQGLVMEDWHNFGADYARTLNAWRENFIKAWPELKLSGKFGQGEEAECFYRMWIYYLTSCEAAFMVRSTQLWQIVLSPNGVRHEDGTGYIPVR